MVPLESATCFCPRPRITEGRFLGMSAQGVLNSAKEAGHRCLRGYSPCLYGDTGVTLAMRHS